MTVFVWEGKRGGEIVFPGKRSKYLDILANLPITRAWERALRLFWAGVNDEKHYTNTIGRISDGKL
jgi:hypothetical protein